MGEGDGLIEGYSFIPPLTPLERRFMELSSDGATKEQVSAELGLPIVAVQAIEVDIVNKLVDHQSPDLGDNGSTGDRSAPPLRTRIHRTD